MMRSTFLSFGWISKGMLMRAAFFVILWMVVFSAGVGAEEEIYKTKDGEYVVVRTEERSSGRGFVRLGVLAILVACGGGAAVASQRTFKRPKNRTRLGSGTTSTGIRKPVRPTFNKPKNRM